MSIVADVRETLDRTQDVEDFVAMDEALREAERLADMFEEVKPQSYVVPIERFVGMPVFQGKFSARK